MVGAAPAWSIVHPGKSIPAGRHVYNIDDTARNLGSIHDYARGMEGRPLHPIMDER